MCISKRPEIPGCLDVRLNVLVFQDIYTYFLGFLDVNSKWVFYIYIAELQSVLNATFKVDLLDSRFAMLEKMMVWTI